MDCKDVYVSIVEFMFVSLDLRCFDDEANNIFPSTEVDDIIRHPSLYHLAAHSYMDSHCTYINICHHEFGYVKTVGSFFYYEIVT